MAGAGSISPSPSGERRAVLAAVFALGASCVMTQLAVMREAMGVFAGNELVLGIVLGNWLLLMGLGATLGRRAPRIKEPWAALVALLIFTAIAPAGQIVALRGAQSFAFLRGLELGVMPTAVATFVVLAPFCLAAGFTLTLAAVMLSGIPGATVETGTASRVYVADSLGSIAGGAVFSFVLVHWLDHLALLTVPALGNLAAAGGLAWQRRRCGASGSSWLVGVAGALGAGWLALVIFASPDAASTAIQYPGQRLLFRGNSPYGRLVVTETGGQLNFLENGVAIALLPDIETAEETAHYAMAQRPGARKVLLISGGLSGAAREILRYGVSELHCVELDPLVVAAGRRFAPQEFTDARLRFFTTDPRRFVRRTGAKYEVVIVALPDPGTTQLNRFFTAEFFAETKRILAPGGVLAFAVGRYENYVSDELAAMLSCARRTAASEFRNVVLIPGGRVYFLASDGPVQADVTAALERARMPTRLVNRNYLAAMLAPDRLADIRRASSQPAPLNRDFTPALYRLHLRHWASQFHTGFGLLQVALIVACGVYLLSLRGAALALFASGFAGSALELVLLLGLQVLAGALYQQVGMVVTLFMAGLAAGAGVARDWPAARLSQLAFGIAALAAVLPLVLPALNGLNTAGLAWAIPGIIAVLTFLLAALAGAQFPIASRGARATTGVWTAQLFAADFAGACLGALLTSTFLVPLVGVTGACLVVAVLNGLAGVFSLRRRATA